MHRNRDVVHYWPTKMKKASFAETRTRVSKAIQGLNASVGLDVFTGMLGKAGGVGRNQPQLDYAASMLQFQIVVVCQRDKWEDHFRSMEALVSGAMVMTDPMLPLPYRFVNDSNIIVYRSIAELKSFATYYASHDEERIQIARRGYETAMNYHQPWHLTERLLLGDWNSRII